jgi:hypothetical protein
LRKKRRRWQVYRQSERAMRLPWVSPLRRRVGSCDVGVGFRDSADVRKGREIVTNRTYVKLKGFMNIECSYGCRAVCTPYILRSRAVNQISGGNI